jgi:uncharacterized protein YceK
MFLSACGFIFASPALAAITLTSLASWNGSTGYVAGRPTLVNKVIYGVLGSNSSQNGSVYALTPPASGTAYTISTLATFAGGTAGGTPVGGLVADSAGNLYGAAYSGGSTATACKQSGLSGCGLIYKLTKPASGTTWTRSTVYTFTGGADGIGPVGNLVIDSTGTLYGVTKGGGCTPSLDYPIGCGTVFKLVPSGSSFTYAQAYKFQGGAADGAAPAGPLALDKTGDIYGATQYGGAANCSTGQAGGPDARCGTVFKLTKSGTSYTEAILHIFTDGTDGSIPSGGVVLDKDNNVYGTTIQGGTDTGLCLNFNFSGCGQVFKLTKPKTGTVWKKTALYNFLGSDGATPSSLLITSKGQLFGVNAENSTAQSCAVSAYYCGTAWKLVATKGVWKETVLQYFTGSSSIAGPVFGLAGDSSDNVYGVGVDNVTSTAFSLSGTGYAPLP